MGAWHDIGRDAFLDRVWAVEGRVSGGAIISQQMRRMGSSVDWNRTSASRWTKACRPQSWKTFVRLYDEGLIYRGKRLVNWDPVLCTRQFLTSRCCRRKNRGHLWHFRYPLSDGSDGHVVVATTRPETMLGDTAVAVHPEDERVSGI